MTDLWVLVVAYLLGAIPTGYLLVKRFEGEDVRRVGSGSIGATNVSRAAGLPLGVVVLCLDAAKGALAVWLAVRWVDGSQWWVAAAALAVVVGNSYPVFLRFRGGKGFATATGAMLVLAPLPAAALVPVFVVVAAITRHISAGSAVSAISAPLAVWLIEHPPLVKVLTVALMAAVILWRHRENLGRLHEGTEPEFSFRRR